MILTLFIVISLSELHYILGKYNLSFQKNQAFLSKV
jgi:hypothetical protein